MLKLVLVALALYCVACLPCAPSNETNCYDANRGEARILAEKRVEEIRKDVLSNKTLTRVTEALDNALSRASYELTKRGQFVLAEQINDEWQNEFRHSLLTADRGIGDHESMMLSQWLTTRYRQIEFILGQDICVKTHIGDIFTINCTLKVVFKPCSFPMDAVTGDRATEYKRHFAGGKHNDEIYDGLIPVVTYWVIEGVTMATGAGVIIGALAAPIGERLMENYVAPKLSDTIYNRACN